MKIRNSIQKFTLVMGLGLTLIVAGCGGGAEQPAQNPGEQSGENETQGATEEVQGFEHITGIDAGAGVMTAAEKAIEEYGLDIDLVPSSDAAMTAELKTKYENKEWVVVTGWTPHWKFAAYDLKYLDDPKGVFGEEENIHTLARLGLKEDKPEAYQVLDNFFWTPDDMSQVMIDIAQNNMGEVEAAQAWIDANRDKVDSWIEGVTPVDGDSIHLSYVTWDSEIASTNVLALVLEEVGYKVELTPLEAGHVWNSIFTGDADATVAAWLPATHGHFYEQGEGQFDDLGPNLEGAKIGLVVPTYVTIDSIEEITSKK